MKRFIILSLIGFALVAANVNHEIKVSVGDDNLDSVRCSCFTAQAGVTPPASVATFKLAAFPKDTLVTIPDTCNVKISCLYYFTGTDGYLLSSEIVPVKPLTPLDTPSLAVNIANRVHDEDTTNHLAELGDPGKMAYHYSRTGAGGGGSSGCGDSLGYTRTIVLIDTSAVPDVVLNGIDIYFNNQPQSGEPYRVTTNNLGRASLGLNAGNWVRLHTDPRYLPDTDSFTVAGVGIDTMRLCQVVLLDTDTLTTTVVFYIKKPNGTPNDSAVITIELLPYNRDSILYINNTIIAASYAQWPLRGNSAGVASEHLYGNSLFTNDSSYYRATVRNRFTDKILDVFKFRVPVSDSVNYVHLLPRWK